MHQFSYRDLKLAKIIKFQGKDIFKGHKQSFREVGSFLSFSIRIYGLDRSFVFFDYNLKLKKMTLD